MPVLEAANLFKALTETAALANPWCEPKVPVYYCMLNSQRDSFGKLLRQIKHRGIILGAF